MPPTPGSAVVDPPSGLSRNQPLSRDLLLLALLGIPGVVASYLSVNIPNTAVFFDLRFAFGFVAFALLGRWSLAILLAAALSASGFHKVSLTTAFLGNMLYALPSVVVVRVVFRRWLVRLALPVLALGWVAMVLAINQLLITPAIWAVLAHIESRPIWPGIVDGWLAQPFLAESVLNGSLSALAICLWISHRTTVRGRNLLSTTLDSIGDAVIVTDPAGRVTRMNPVAEKLTGFSAGQARRRPISEVFRIVNDQTRRPADNPVQRVLEEGIVVGLANHTVLISRDGSERAIADSAAPIRDVDGTLRGVVMVFRDVSAEYARWTRLRQSEQYQQALLDASPQGVVALDMDGKVITWNRAAERILGFPAAQVLGQALPIIPPDARAEARAMQARVRQGESFSGVEVSRLRQDGSRVEVSLSTGPVRDADGTISATMALFEDLSERNRSARQLALQATVLAQIQDVVTVTDLDGNITYVNQAVTRHLNCEKDDLIGRNVCDAFGDDPAVRASQAEIIETTRREGSWRGQVINLTAEGNRVVLDCRTQVVRDGQGRAIGMCGISTDITERVQAEQALRKSEQRFRSFVEHASDIVYSLTPDGEFLYISPNWQELMGEPAEKAIGRNFRQYVHPEDVHLCEEFLARVLEEEQPQTSVEYRTLRPDGQIRWHVSKGSVLADAERDSVRYIGIARDVTSEKQAEIERQSLEEQLRQSQKLEAIGRLAGGVAHDFNNMLQAITGHAEMLLDEAQPDTPLHESLQEIRSAAERSSDLTRQLLAFARKQTITPRTLEINEAVAESLKMLQRLIGEDTALLWKPSPRARSVCLDPVQLDQILANLVVNARDAIESNGRITIETDSAAFDQQSSQDHPDARPGAYAVLAVSDNGVGMDAETASRIFEPFFTTKPDGQGTGLGLATVYGICKQNGGFIHVESRPGRGTTFRVYLPRVEDDPSQPPREQIEQQLRGNETILLVEDEEPLLRLGQKILTRYGYRVLPALGPKQAIELAGRTDSTIDLLVTDVVMPHRSGKELHDLLLRDRPGLKCLFISGYTADAIAQHGVLDPQVRFLQKPYASQDLAAKVRRILDEAAKPTRPA